MVKIHHHHHHHEDTETSSAGLRLTEQESAARAARLRVVITDVDGVLTDGGVFYSERGEALKRFSLRDGMGVERLRDQGVETAFMTRENSEIVARRAEKLRLRLCYLGIIDKRAQLDRVLLETGYEVSQIAYIGDDVNDVDIMKEIAKGGGLVGAPSDAMPAAVACAHYVCAQPGGHGAFRDFADWILGARSTTEISTPVSARTSDASGREGAADNALGEGSSLRTEVQNA